ncbi:MAG: hypothetical protein IJ917_06550 [Firmicutes bacterium]|nr:hypothetical protein [Bacillota bacterium]
MQLWGKIVQGHRTVRQYTLTLEDSDRTLVRRVQAAMDEMVMKLDLPRPIWFKRNEEDIEVFGRTEFHQDHFIEPVHFTRFEIELIDGEQ